MRLVNKMALAFLFFALPSAVSASMDQPTNEEAQKLVEIKYQMKALDDLAGKSVITAEAGAEGKAALLAAAKTVFTAPADEKKLLELIQSAEARTAVPKPPLSQKIKGWISLSNICMVMGSILFLWGFEWLFMRYILPYLRNIPKVFYEALAYAACAVFVVWGKSYPADIGQFIALPGIIGLTGALAFSYRLHRELIDRWHRAIGVAVKTSVAFLLSLSWGALAILLESPVIGFMTVMAFETFLGFTVLVEIGCVSIGFERRDPIPKATLASLALLAVFVCDKIFNFSLPFYEIFSVGVYFVATFVYFIGLLILSWMRYNHGRTYWLMQIITILSGALALGIGSIYDIVQLKSIGGTFFMIYLVEKYCELPFIRRHLAWGAFLGGILLYFSSLFIRLHPDFFMF